MNFAPITGRVFRLRRCQPEQSARQRGSFSQTSSTEFAAWCYKARATIGGRRSRTKDRFSGLFIRLGSYACNAAFITAFLSKGIRRMRSPVP